jgi:hypothetical protein
MLIVLCISIICQVHLLYITPLLILANIHNMWYRFTGFDGDLFND